MKRKLVLIFLSLFMVLTGFLAGHYRKFLAHKIFRKTITVEEFLNIQDKNRYSELYINDNGDIEYKKKVMIKKDTFKPLSYDNMVTQEEMKILYKSGWYRFRGVDI